MIFELNTYRQILLLPPDSCLITSLLISVKKRHGFKKLQIWNFSPPRQHRKNPFWGYFEQNDFWAKYLPTDPLTASWLMSDHFAVDFSEKKAWFQKAPNPGSMKFLPTPAASKKSILSKMIFELNTYRQILLLPPDSCLITSLLISVKKRHGFKKLQKWNFSPPRQHRKNPFWGYFEQNDFWAKYLPTDPLTASWLMSDHSCWFQGKNVWSLRCSVKKRHGFKKLQKWNFSPPRQHRKNPFWRLFWAKWFLS